MTLDWNEIRARAARFSEDWKSARYERGQTQTFYNEFFAIFGIDRKRVAVYEQRVRNLPGQRQGFIDLFMPGKLIVEQKSAGLDLRQASNQALDYFEALPEADRPRYILACDFQNWHLVDLQENGREWRFTLPELKQHIGAFAFIAGAEVRRFRNQKPVNPKASELLSRLHRHLAQDGYAGHKLQLLLVRLLFILFADDTAIWPKDQLLIDLQEHTREDGSDLGSFLTQLFEVLNTPEAERQGSLAPHLRRYPFINGKLFGEPIGTATFNRALRETLIEASGFDWGAVSPAIFGALFEGVIDAVTRRRQGAHYTPEEAIFRVIGPLFLEDLHREFAEIKARKDGGRRKALERFHDKLASLTFFDPACGAGNFLVVTYRELRELEREVIEEIHPPESRQGVLDVALLTKVNVDQFYGIELDEFPSQIAQVALWMTDHIANVNLGEVFGRSFARVPLVTAPNIRHGDALEMDWAEVLPPERCSYVFGNPPFVGAKMQTEQQRAQVRQIAKLGGSGGTLDYVAAWFLKAASYVQGGEARIAFVATNSITQGEQVAQLWPKLFARGMEIAFAHRTFVWPGRAAVHCVIVGLAQRGQEPRVKRLFSYPAGRGEPVETQHEWLTAYLFGAGEQQRHGVVKKARGPFREAKPLIIGSKPIDGGFYIFGPAERIEFIAKDPIGARFLRPFVGAEEYINGGERWILALHHASARDIRSSPLLSERVKRVRAFRKASRSAPTQALAQTPTSYHVNVIPASPFLVIPKVSSERRDYVPIGWLEPPTIPSDLVFVLENATLYDFAILTSAMHMAWLRQIGGRLKSDFRYSIGLVYNTFPWPDAAPDARDRVARLAKAVLDARALDKNATSTLADLYDPDFMPPELRKAHRDLDAAVDRLYRPKGFADDRERVEHLFQLYEALVMPTSGAARANRRTARRMRD